MGRSIDPICQPIDQPTRTHPTDGSQQPPPTPQVVPKYDGSSKKLLHEMILVCNALRNDLNHPNEYVRGSMLRFLCKLREPELLEPLVPSIKVRGWRWMCAC